MKPGERTPDEKDKKILTLIAHGNPYKSIASNVGLSVEGIKKRVKALKNHYHVTSTPALIHTYTKG